MARLRAPDGCPWDREQTHQSLAETLVEETSELLEAIDNADMALMKEELGDVLLQVVFHAQMAEEAGHFTFDDVARAINDKLIRRHPHVFGAAHAETSGEVLTQWEEIKAAEKAASGKAAETLFKDAPPRLPALLYARDTYKRLSKRGLTHLEPLEEDAVEAVAEELSLEEAGQILFEVTAACYRQGLDPETALRQHTDRLRREIEARLGAVD